MPKEMINGTADGSVDSLVLKKVPRPKKVLSPLLQNFSSAKTVKQKSLKSDGTPVLINSSEGLAVLQNGYGSGLDSPDGSPLVVRKDRLVQEIENSLAEIEDHYSSTSKLEEERTAVEMERNSLLKDIEETITEIQNHVLNSSDLALEKGALQEECDGLRDQVDHLKVMLDNSDDVNNGDEADGLYPSSKKLKQQNLALKAEIDKLTYENETLKSKESSADMPSDLMTRELELLHDENANLQKLLHMAEESEENMAKELTSCHSKLTETQKLNESLKKEMKQLKSLKEQLELDREDLEEEVDSLQKRLNGNHGDQNGNVLMLKESKEDLANAQKKCSLLEKENNTLNKKIEQLEKEIQQGKDERSTESESTTTTPKAAQNVQQLKSALDKLNKETSSLHDSLEKAEKEIASLKGELEKEREEKEKLKLTANEKGKKKNKKGKELETETSKDDEERVNEVDVLKKEVYNLKSECQCLSETVAKTANEKRQMAKEIETLTENKTKLESKVIELEGIVENLTRVKSEKETLEGSYSHLKTLHDELEQKLDIANKNNNEKDEMLRRTLTERESVEKLCKEHEVMIEKTKNDLAASRQEVLSKSNDLKLLKNALEEQSDELTTACDIEQKEKQRLQEEIKEMNKRFKSTENELNTALQAQTSKGSELQNLRITVDEMRKELKLTKQNLRDAEEARVVAEEKIQTAEKAKEDLEKSNAVFNDMAMEKSLELSRTKRTLEKKVEKLTKENSEMRKKFGYEVPMPARSQTPPRDPPRLSPVAVHMQKIPSLDVNLEHLSKPSQRVQRRSRDPSPSSRVIAVNGPMSENRLQRRPSEDSNSSNGRQNHDSDYVKPQRNELVNSAPSEYRVITASEVASAPPKQQFTSSVVHVMTSSGRDVNSAAAKDESEYDRGSYSKWRDDDREREERRVEERQPEESRERPPDYTAKQDNSESAFQVVGYRKGSKVIHEHWV